jgi:hypothetical protein
MTPTVVYDYTKDWIYDENAPWTTLAETVNDPSQKKTKAVQIVPPLPEWHFFRGDRVIYLFIKI